MTKAENSRVAQSNEPSADRIAADLAITSPGAGNERASTLLGGGVTPASSFRLLDLFCAAGGAAMGYHQAGFEVVGVDINPQPHYPFEFIQADCLSLDAGLLGQFDAIHASPPCQKYTRKTATWGRERKHWVEHPDLIEPTRDLLTAVGVPYVIENVVGAPLRAAVTLCGTQFGLRIIKHRQFETNWNLRACDIPCDHSDVYNPWSGKGRSAVEHRAAQGTPWIPQCGGASRKAGVTGDLNNAIPPAYTQFIGEQLIAHCAPHRATSMERAA